LAVEQRLRRIIMDENGGGTGVGGMRAMHKTDAPHSIFIAVEQRLRRIIMNENGGRTGVGGMRVMHKTEGRHAIFIAVTEGQNKALNVL
jgi:hypothetical protein